MTNEHSTVLHDDYFGKLWIDETLGLPWLHHEFRDIWCLSTYKKALQILLLKIKDIPHPHIYVIMDKDEVKLAEMFGFYTYDIRNGYYIMRFDNE